MGNFYSAPQNDVEHKYDFFIKIVLEHNSMNMGAKLHMGQRLKFFFFLSWEGSYHLLGPKKTLETIDFIDQRAKPEPHHSPLYTIFFHNKIKSCKCMKPEH